MTIFKPEPAALSYEFILANYPSLAEAFRAEGFERGLVQGAENERNRIQLAPKRPIKCSPQKKPKASPG